MVGRLMGVRDGSVGGRLCLGGYGEREGRVLVDDNGRVAMDATKGKTNFFLRLGAASDAAADPEGGPGLLDVEEAGVARGAAGEGFRFGFGFEA